MARYGIDFYGSNVYGSPSFVDFDASPFEVLPYDVGINQLHWTIPGGQYTRIRLVRNAYGWPVHEDDGIVLFDDNSGPAAVAPLDPPVSDYLDTDLQPGRLFYYSIFVLAFDTTNLHDEWRRAADTTCISVGKYNYTERMLSLLPDAYWADPSDPSGRNNALTGFMSIFGFQLDVIRSQYESLRHLYDPDRVAAALLLPLGDMFGIPFEPEIGVRQQRAMVRNALYISRRKSTSTGTNTLISSFTGWDATVSVGSNLMLDYNDSSFEEGLGRWETVGNTCTLLQRATDNTAAAFQAPDFTNKQFGMLQLTSTVAGAIQAACGVRSPIAAAVPITAGQTYTFSAYFRTAVTARQCATRIRFCKGDGTVISDSAPGPTVTSTTTGWTRAAVSVTAPANGVYAVPMVQVAATAIGEVHYVDAAQFELGASASAFQEARDIRVTLTAERINELPNPSAEINLTGWSASQATLARDATVAYSGVATSTAPSTKAGAPNAASFKLTSTTTGAGIARTSVLIPVLGGTDYALSAYVFGQRNAQLSIDWFDATQVLMADQTATGQSYNWINGAWFRPEASGTSPDDAAYARVTVSGQFTGVGQTLWFDQVLFERSAEVRPYFDASQFHSRPADHIWEGAAHQSRSHYYFNRASKQFRLDDMLTDYLLPGRTHTLLVAQPFRPDPGVYSEDSGYGWGPYGQVPYSGTPSHGFGSGSYGGVPYVI